MVAPTASSRRLDVTSYCALHWILSQSCSFEQGVVCTGISAAYLLEPPPVYIEPWADLILGAKVSLIERAGHMLPYAP